MIRFKLLEEGSSNFAWQGGGVQGPDTRYLHVIKKQPLTKHVFTHVTCSHKWLCPSKYTRAFKIYISLQKCKADEFLDGLALTWMVQFQYYL